jgi:folate-binding protein YgfZ
VASTHTDTAAADYEAVLRGCGLLDRSERGKLALSGADAVEFLDGQVTNELGTRSPGEGCYAAFLTHKGKMLGDVRILALGESRDGPVAELLLDTERVCLQALFDMIRRYKVGYDVQLHKRTLEHGLLSLIGPRAGELAGAEPLGQEHDHSAITLDGLPARAVRTDVGIDLLCAASDTDALAEVLRVRGVSPVGAEAAECLRIERGRPRYGVDLDDSVIPQEAGLNERAVSFTKGCYVGQETVARLYYRGKPNRHLRGLRMSEPLAAGAELRLGDRAVGSLTSSCLSPRLGPIGLALVRREAEPGSTVTVGEGGVNAQVVELPFAGG